MPMLAFLSDAYLFPLLQGLLILFLVLAIIMAFIARMRAHFDGARVSVTRGEKSMGIFYGIYAAVSGLFVALCLSVDWAKDYRVAWVLLDTLIASYLCLLNRWFRNKLLALAVWLTEIEAR